MKLFFTGLACCLLFACGSYSSKERLAKAELLLPANSFKADLTSAYIEGIQIPSQEEDYLKFAFDLSNSSRKAESHYYRIYYQNKTYKHQEANGTTYNAEASDNFYGSWESDGSEFKKIENLEPGASIHVLDSFKIVGNPRNEIKYFGAAVMDQMVDEKAIEGRLNLIRITPDWMASVEEKAKTHNRNVEDQMYVDALWTLDNEMDPKEAEILKQDTLLKAIENQILNTQEWLASIEKKAQEKGVDFQSQLDADVKWSYKERNPGMKIFENNRKKRNPRMGEYEFLLVVLNEREYQQLPPSIKEIGKKDEQWGAYMNPFFFFDSTQYENQKACHWFEDNIRVSASFTGERGVYIDPLSLKNPNTDKSYYSDRVGSNTRLYQEASYEQYFHVIDKDYKLKNVPLVANVAEGEYGVELYEKNKEKYVLEDRPNTHTYITNSPGKTVYYDSTAGAVRLVNPGNSNPKLAKKENVGVKTRVGLSYGKFTGKIKFTKTMNKENIWNGVTAAFWLFSEKMEPWNSRNICEKEGYLPKHERKPSENKFPSSMYSEIDIEIIKSSKYWPQTSYGGIEDYPVDDPKNNNNLIITCTNWDMTCQDPIDFNQGVKNIQYQGKEFGLHRWDYWYHALTSKFEHPHDQTLGDVFYYQIEWKPTEIIWRVGPSEENMTVVGYMSEDNTKIPNNQMVTIVTQEFHYSEWWPLSPFDQNNIPFPKEDLEGLVYEIKVE